MFSLFILVQALVIMISLGILPNWFNMEHDDDHEDDYYDIEKYLNS